MTKHLPRHHEIFSKRKKQKKNFELQKEKKFLSFSFEEKSKKLTKTDKTLSDVFREGLNDQKRFVLKIFFEQLMKRKNRLSSSEDHLKNAQSWKLMTSKYSNIFMTED